MHRWYNKFDIINTKDGEAVSRLLKFQEADRGTVSGRLNEFQNLEEADIHVSSVLAVCKNYLCSSKYLSLGYHWLLVQMLIYVTNAGSKCRTWYRSMMASHSFHL